MAFLNFDKNLKKMMFTEASKIIILEPDGYIHDGTLLLIYRKTKSVKGLEFSDLNEFSGYVPISEKVYQQLLKEMIIFK